jgi:hypothetical protein
MNRNPIDCEYTRNAYQPLLTDAELSQINSEREEAIAASLAARAPAEYLSLVKHTDGSERLLRGKSADELPVVFGGCGCSAGFAVCNCGLASWISPASLRVRPEPAQPSERSWFWSDLLIAVLSVAMAAAVVLQWGKAGPLFGGAL